MATVNNSSNHQVQQYNVVVGAANNLLTAITPGANAGQMFQSGGSSANPIWSTATYPSTAGTSGNYLKSDGTNFVSTAFPSDLHDSQFIVGNTLLGANYSSLSAAMAAAVAGNTIFFQPGTYNIGTQAWTAGVNLSALPCDAWTPNVILNGQLTYSGSGSVSATGMQLVTNSSNFLAMSGSNASIVNLYGCFLNCLNNTGISNTCSNSSSQLNIYYGSCDTGTTGVAYLSDSSAGSTTIEYSEFLNSGGSSTANTKSAGQLSIKFSTFRLPITYSSSNTLSTFQQSTFNTASTNSTFLTTSGTGTVNINQSNINSGSSSCISVGSGTTVTSRQCNMNSSNTNVVTGSGTFNYGGLEMTGSSHLTNATTQVGDFMNMGGISFDAGNNSLQNFTDWGSWTPTITGSGTAGTTTYTVQTGTYMRIGNLAICSFGVTYTAATGSGNMTLGGLPFTVNGTGFFAVGCRVGGSTYTYPTGVTNVTVEPVNGATTAIFQGSGSAIASTQLQMQNVTTAIRGMAIFRI